MNNNNQVINNFKEDENDEELPVYTLPTNIELHPLNIHFILYESRYYRDLSKSNNSDCHRQRCNFRHLFSTTKKNKKNCRIRRVFSNLCFFTYKIML